MGDFMATGYVPPTSPSGTSGTNGKGGSGGGGGGGGSCNVSGFCTANADKGGGGGSGNQDVIGSIVAKSISINGHFNLHYDESLRTNGPTF